MHRNETIKRKVLKTNENFVHRMWDGIYRTAIHYKHAAKTWAYTNYLVKQECFVQMDYGHQECHPVYQQRC